MQPSSFGSVLKQRNPSGIHMPDTDMFFANVPFEELKKACKGFHISQQIGKGGFGEVYKGRRNHQDIGKSNVQFKISSPDVNHAKVICTWCVFDMLKD